MKLVGRMIAAALILSIAVGCQTEVTRVDAAVTASELPVLKLVPENALALVIVNHLDKADEQISKLTAEMQLPVPSVLPLLKMAAGIREGVDDQRSAVLALIPGAADGAAPVGVHFFPVTDYKKFIGQLNPDDAAAKIAKVTFHGHPAMVGQKGDFAVLADNADAVERVLSSSRSVEPVIGSLSGWVAERAISFVATPTGVKQGVAVARKGLAQVKAVMASSNDETTKMAAGNLGIYDWILAGADKEINEFAVGLRVDNDGGLHIDTRTLFVSGGSWAESGKGLARPEGAKLSCLPGGPFMMAFGGVMPKSFPKSFLNMSVDMINNMSKASGGKELTEDQTKQLNELMEKSMADVGAMSMVMGAPKPGGSLYGNMAAVMKVKNAQQYMTDYRKAIESMRDLFGGAGAGIPLPQEIKQVKIDGMDGLELTMDMSAMFKNMPHNPASDKMIEMMIGRGGKLTAYMVPIDETTVAMSYVSSDNIARVKTACKNPQSSLAADADIAQTEKLLPEGAQWVGYLSPKGFVDFIGAMMLGFAPPGAAMPAIPAFPQTPPIGIGAELSGQSLDLQIVVPGAALKGVGTYVKQMQQMAAPKAQAPQRARAPQAAPPPQKETPPPIR